MTIHKEKIKVEDYDFICMDQDLVLDIAKCILACQDHSTMSE